MKSFDGSLIPFYEMDRLSTPMRERTHQNSKNGYEVYTPKISLDKTIYKTCDIKLLDKVFSKWLKPTGNKNEYKLKA
tara:strand:- start:225 stop:455 length:231 start_codon:yes stop_codon:yes gene_type:complete